MNRACARVHVRAYMCVRAGCGVCVRVRASVVRHHYNGTAGESVSNTPNRFLRVTLCLEYLSSGEKRAGWAEMVGLPAGSVLFSV